MNLDRPSVHGVIPHLLRNHAQSPFRRTSTKESIGGNRPFLVLAQPLAELLIRRQLREPRSHSPLCALPMGLFR